MHPSGWAIFVFMVGTIIAIDGVKNEDDFLCYITIVSLHSHQKFVFILLAKHRTETEAHIEFSVLFLAIAATKALRK